MSELMTCHLYGAPEGSTLVDVEPGTTSWWRFSEGWNPPLAGAGAADTEPPKEHYVLIEAPDGDRAFVPRDDDRLLEALQSSKTQANRRAVAALEKAIADRKIP